jgi:hypothetical protein
MKIVERKLVINVPRNKLSRVLIVIIYMNVYDKIAQIIASYTCMRASHGDGPEGVISR